MCLCLDDPDMKYTLLTHLNKGIVVNAPSRVHLLPALHTSYTLIKIMFMCHFSYWPLNWV